MRGNLTRLAHFLSFCCPKCKYCIHPNPTSPLPPNSLGQHQYTCCGAADICSVQHCVVLTRFICSVIQSWIWSLTQLLSVLVLAQGMSLMRNLYQDGTVDLGSFLKPDAGAPSKLLVCWVTVLASFMLTFQVKHHHYQGSLSTSLLKAFWVNSSRFALVNFLPFLWTIF